MHELSLVEALLESVTAEQQRHPGARVRCVRVRVGRLRQVAPSAMTFAWEASVRETPLAGARLELERVAAVARCPACQKEFPVEERWFECPGCGATGGQLISGDELQLAEIELSPAV